MGDFQARVTAILDDSDVQSKLANLIKDKTVKINVDLTSKDGGVKNILNQIKSQFDSAGTSIGANLANSINVGVGKVNINNIANQVNNIQRSARSASAGIKSVFSEMDVSRVSASISSLNASFTKLKGAENEQSASLKRLKEDLSNLSNIQDLGRRQAEFERITQEVEKLSIAYKQAKADVTAVAAAQQLMTSKTKLGNDVETWMTKNTKAAKIYKKELDELNKSIQTVSNPAQQKAAEQQFALIKSQAAANGQLGNNMFTQIAKNITKISPMFSAGYLMMSGIREVKEMASTVTELDTALVDLQKTTTMSNSQLEQFYGDSNKIAIQMGVSTKQIIEQAAAWSRLGYSSKEEASTMAKLSSQFASISPGMDTDKATEGLVSMMKAFDVDPDNVLDGIMSKVNIVGNTAATSNENIVDMLSRSSSAMAEANNSLEETIALETAAFEITQDASSVGRQNCRL